MPISKYLKRCSELLNALKAPTKHCLKTKNNHKSKQSKSSKNYEDQNLGCWNIRRGLVKRELEILELCSNTNLSVLFLTETDSFQINEAKDYQLPGYSTLFHAKITQMIRPG